MPSVATTRPHPMQPEARYNGIARLFHWLVVLLVLMQFATKIVPKDWLGIFSEQRLDAWHLGIGPTILVLTLVRLAWRLTHAVPPAPDDLSPPLQLVSRATHWAFYAVLVLLPALGWAAASGYGARATILGLVPLPALIARNDATAAVIGAMHGVAAWVLLALIALHVGGALYHGMIKRDGVVGRMLP